MNSSQNAATANQPTRAPHGVRIKTIALPAEHGGWGLLFEPIALGLLLAPSIAGFYLAFSAVGLFLARHPLTLVVMNRRRPSARNALAKRFAAIYLIIGAASFIAAIAFTQHPFFMPLLIAAPLAVVQLAHDWTGRRRVLLPELAAAIAISSLAPAIAFAGGYASRQAFALWFVMIARAVPSILYVRGCLARLHRRPVSISPILISQVVALLMVTLLAGAKLVPLLAVAAVVLLLIRAVIGFTRRENMTPKQLGFGEIFFGALTVLAVVLGTILEL